MHISNARMPLVPEKQQTNVRVKESKLATACQSKASTWRRRVWDGATWSCIDTQRHKSACEYVYLFLNAWTQQECGRKEGNCTKNSVSNLWQSLSHVLFSFNQYHSTNPFIKRPKSLSGTQESVQDMHLLTKYFHLLGKT